MVDISTLQTIREKWLAGVARRLTRREGIRAEIEENLVVFFDQLVDAAIKGHPDMIEPTVKMWAFSSSQAQPVNGSGSMVLMICEIMDESLSLLSTELSPEQTVTYTKLMVPVFVHAIDIAATYELDAHLMKIQNELVKAQNVLERVEKSKSDFISVAAHELRTPLTLIEGYSSMLHDALPTNETQRLQSALCLKGINAGTKRLREIVDDMIDVSMIDNNLLTLNYQPIWINRLCTAVQRELNETIQQRGQKFVIMDFPGSNELIFADGERIYQALRNIITNAVKYTPDGGTITVDGRVLPGFIEVVVIDSGIGIDQGDQLRIFEKFGNLGDAALHSSGKTKFKGGGPGLGLSITKGIIEAHGGAIWVESEGFDEQRCPGSVFHLMIPSRKSPPDQHAARNFVGLIEQK